MNPITIGVLVFACTFGSALAGLWLHGVLPQDHLSDQSQATVKVGIGLIATMTALVLGLVTASAKSSFDAIDAAVKQSAADILILDRTLARFGPESEEIRTQLRDTVASRIEATWSGTSPQSSHLGVSDALRNVEGLMGGIHGLAPKDDDQIRLKSRALNLGEKLLEVRWAVSSSIGPSIPVPLLVVLASWLMVIFASFGLFAPKNGTVIGMFFICALSVASAIFLILEMDGPVTGVIRISPEPLNYALTQMNQ